MQGLAPANEMPRLGLISDTHNHLQNVARAVAHFEAEGIRIVLHAGDVTSVDVLRLLEPFELWLAWGNCDRDQKLHEIVAGQGSELRQPIARHAGYLHALTFDGIKVALLHGDNIPQLAHLVDSGDYDVVIHGHTHSSRDEFIGSTRVINPGSLGGTGLLPKTFAILDLATGDLQILEA